MEAHAIESPHERRVSLLRLILAFSILSTGIHYTHNFVEIDRYPQSGIGISNGVIQAAVLLAWPVLTAIGIWGYRHYARGDYSRAYVPLLIYSVTGLVTMGHFTDGVPDIPAFFFATIFTDLIAGVAVIAFVIWSKRTAA